MLRINQKLLEKLIKEKDVGAEIKIDTPTSFRIFIYSQRQKFPITALIDRQRKYKITKISDYPKQKGHYPICVVRVERLRIVRKKAIKAKPATTTTPTANIKEIANSLIVIKNG